VSVVYDAGVLIAAERNDREVWADHRARLELGVVATTTAPVVAQVSRSAEQVQLRRFLRGCDVAGFGPEHAHEVGKLLGEAGTSDVVDAQVVLIAAGARSTVLTSDQADLQRVSNALARPVQIRPVGGVRRPRRQ
jgi:hypothetical protein